MLWADLNTHQKSLLRLLKENPNYQFTGIESTDMNYLMSQKITSYIGNMRYELTDEGEKLVTSDPLYIRFTSEQEIPA
jgi:hypothetical protein